MLGYYRDVAEASVIIDNSLLPKDTFWAWKSPKISGTWALGLVALTAVAGQTVYLARDFVVHA